ncbi:hypothetical protein JW960_11520 [candidate division KSB1 bacterium]|nr:hypothetical protein [candidate division KSB1 bacterium]
MDNRQTYIDQFTAQLKIWDAKINRMQVESENARDDLKAKYDTKIEELMNHRNALQQKLKLMVDASDSAWTQLRSGFEKSWKDMSDAIKKAVDELS